MGLFEVGAVVAGEIFDSLFRSLIPAVIAGLLMVGFRVASSMSCTIGGFIIAKGNSTAIGC